MSIIKEFREFFLRNAPLSVGAKKDQENSFPATYKIGNETVFNRFLKNHFPSENVMKKFLESITFKLNAEDTATETTQGLVKKATDAKAIARDSTDASNMTTIVLPHQLPVVANSDGSLEVEEILTDLGGGKTRRDYDVKSALPKVILSNQLSVAGVGTDANFTEKVLFTYTLPANSVVVGDQILIEGYAQAPTALGTETKLKFGATTLSTVAVNSLQGGQKIYFSCIINIVAAASEIALTDTTRFVNDVYYLANKSAVSLAIDTTADIVINLTGKNIDAAFANTVKAFGLTIKRLKKA